MSSVPEEVERLIESEPLVAHLATSVDDRPHSAPLWYRYEDGVVEIATTGQKLANLERNPRVAISIQSDEGGTPQWMVTLLGTAAVVDDDDAASEGHRRIHEKYGADPDAYPENQYVEIDVSTVSYTVY